MEYLSHSPKETEKIAFDFAKNLMGGEIIAFKGGMGVGKTAFVRGMADGLNVDAQVSSPTFSIVHEYRGNPSLYHFDMFRITDLDDLYSIGFFDYLENGGILAIEWSENIMNALPLDKTIFIDIEILNENERKIIINGGNEI